METIYYLYGVVFISTCISLIYKCFVLANEKTEKEVRESVRELTDVASKAKEMDVFEAIDAIKSIRKVFVLDANLVETIWIFLGLFTFYGRLFALLLFIRYVALPVLRFSAPVRYGRFVFAFLALLQGGIVFFIVNNHFNFF